MLTLTAKEETPDTDPIVVIVSRYRLNLLGPSCEEEEGSIGRGWQGRYYRPSSLGLPVLPVGGPNNGRYDLREYQEVVLFWRMMKIEMLLNILLRKEQKKPP